MFFPYFPMIFSYFPVIFPIDAWFSTPEEAKGCDSEVAEVFSMRLEVLWSEDLMNFQIGYDLD